MSERERSEAPSGVEEQNKTLPVASLPETFDCGCPVDGDERCEDCCDHGDVDSDERCCLDCGKDFTEQLMARAYDQWKASKYED